MTGSQPADLPAAEGSGHEWAVTPCSAEPGLLSEGPRWDAARNELLWVDVLAGKLHRACLGADGQLQVQQTIQVNCHLGAAAPVAAAGTCWLPAPASSTSTTRAPFVNWRSPSSAALTSG
jgi:hypothetical protein